MNIPLLIAATLLCCTAVAHSYLGERFILIRLLRRSDLPRLLGDDDFMKQTLRLAWHITSVVGFGFAALLVIIASHPVSVFSRKMTDVIAITTALSGLVALVGSRGRHLSWIAFFLISALAWFGA
jgi:hypothetical protein